MFYEVLGKREKVIGIDLNKENIKIAKEKYSIQFGKI